MISISNTICINDNAYCSYKCSMVHIYLQTEIVNQSFIQNMKIDCKTICCILYIFFNVLITTKDKLDW